MTMMDLIAVPHLFVGTRPDRECFKAIDMAGDRPLGKPRGGLWTSPYIEGESDWVRWCRSEMPHWLNKSWWKVTIEKSAKVLAINSRGSFLDVLREYPYTYPLASGIAQDSFLAGDRYCMEFDYAKILSEGFDGVHITSSVLFDGEPIPLRLDYMCLYGWDAESTVWLRWVVKEAVEVTDPVSQRSV